MKKNSLLLLLCAVTTVLHSKENIKGDNQPPSVVNIYNVIRKTVGNDDKFRDADYQTAVNQIEINKQYGLPATYALKYDALMNSKYQDLIKSSINVNDEVGVWWEIEKALAEKAGVGWSAAMSANGVTSLAYSPEDRKKMLDVYMEDFYSVFGYYPKSIGSFVVDIVTFEYAHTKYGVLAGAICRDQVAMDAMTLYGGYYDQAYYPSRFNEFIPAQTEKNQIGIPIFRLLAADPIYNLEVGIRDGVEGVNTMEPVSARGRSKDWVEWYFNSKNNEPRIGFSYTQVGQENTFLWESMQEGYEMQIDLVSRMAKERRIRLETLKESAEWYSRRYRLTPPATIATSTDWDDRFDLKTMWYCSRFYRTSLLWEKGRLSVRDLFIYDEKYPSRYLDKPSTEHESTFDALPILYAHLWSNKKKRASIDFRDYKSKEYLNGNEPTFIAKGKEEYKLIWPLVEGKEIEILCKQDRMVITADPSLPKWEMNINTFPVIKEVKSRKIVCNHNGFDYSLELKGGTFSLEADSSLSIIPKESSVEILMAQDGGAKEDDFFLNSYLNNPKIVDVEGSGYINNPIEVPEKFRRPLTPGITPELLIRELPANENFHIENRNESGRIYYTLDGSLPTEKSLLYDSSKGIDLNSSATIKAITLVKGMQPSKVVEAKLYVTLPRKTITGATTPTNNKAYNNNGVFDLIDNVKGSIAHVDGKWLGYLKDMDVTIDLGEVKEINQVISTFLQNPRAWIFFPEYVEVQVSEDGEKFKTLGREECMLLKGIGRQDFNIEFSHQKCRFVKVFAKWLGPCPDWSLCAGADVTYMFVDEITIE